MIRELAHDAAPQPGGVSRRKFIKLAAMTSLLAGCRSAETLITPTSTPVFTPTAPPTSTPASIPTFTPTIPPASKAIRRPEVVKFYPDVPSKVVRACHAGVWDGEELVPNALRQMLDATITELTGLNDVNQAWAALFKPEERIAIKVNTIVGSSGWTHVPLVMAVAEKLQAVGIPPDQIVIFDREAFELKNADFTINQDGPGARCYATPQYTYGWKVVGIGVGLSDILMNCDALINMPILKQHMYAGVSFAMKNHYGTFDRPQVFHPPRTSPAIAELNALLPIQERARLIISDALKIVLGDHWTSADIGDSIFMSFDPVAHDVAGLELLSETMTANGNNPAGYVDKASAWLGNSAELGLGTNDPGNIDLVEVNLG